MGLETGEQTAGNSTESLTDVLDWAVELPQAAKVTSIRRVSDETQPSQPAPSPTWRHTDRRREPQRP